MALAALGYALAIVVLEVPSVLLLGVFVPVMLGLEWAIESRRSFCIRLAFAGKFAFGDETGSVDETSARQRDTATAVRITIVATIAAAALTALIYVGLAGL